MGKETVVRRTAILLALIVAIPAIAPARSAGQSIAPSLDHVGIQASYLARSITFYTNVLGMKEVPAPFPKAEARWVAFADGRLLHIVARGRPGSVHNKWDHFALAFPDLKAVIARLDALHVAWADMAGNRAAQKRPDGVTQIFVTDPDGYQIELNDAGARR